MRVVTRLTIVDQSGPLGRFRWPARPATALLQTLPAALASASACNEVPSDVKAAPRATAVKTKNTVNSFSTDAESVVLPLRFLSTDAGAIFSPSVATKPRGTMANFPHQPEDITTEWLSAALGAAVRSFDVEQIGVGVGLLGRLFRLTLQGDGVPASVVAKFPTLDEGAKNNVAIPLGFYANEVDFYREAAALTPITSAKSYVAEFDDSTHDFVLLLEDLADRRCVDQTVGCDVADARTAIDALAGLHAHWWNSDFAAIPWVKSYLVPPYPQVIAGMFQQSWPVFREVIGGSLPSEYVAFGDRFPELVGWFLEQASEPPFTYCHGDYRLDNLFFGSGGQAPVTVLDWQISFRGNPGYDLGYFMSQSLATDTRRAAQDELIDRYVGALAAKNCTIDRGQLADSYAKTVAYCFIYPVAATGQIELTNERHLALLTGMTDRAVAAIEDAKALSLLPPA